MAAKHDNHDEHDHSAEHGLDCRHNYDGAPYYDDRCANHKYHDGQSLNLKQHKLNNDCRHSDYYYNDQTADHDNNGPADHNNHGSDDDHNGTADNDYDNNYHHNDNHDLRSARGLNH